MIPTAGQYTPRLSILRTNTKFRYMGTNIPGKPKEPLNFVGGFPYYRKALSDSLQNGFAGFSTE
jgi:hypothetical protein